MRFLFRLFTNLFRLALFPLWFLARFISRPKTSHLRVRIAPSLVEIAEPMPWLMSKLPWFAGAVPTSLDALRGFAKIVADDPNIDSVLVELPPLEAGWAHVSALRSVIESLVAAKKHVTIFLPQGGSHREMFVATAASRIVMPPPAQISLIGLASETQYWKPVLDRIGVSFDVQRRAEYKTAFETFSRDSMSDEQREQTTLILKRVDEALRDALRKRSQLANASIDDLFEEAFFSGENAVKAGLVDVLAYEDELPAVVSGSTEHPAKLGGARRYLSYKRARLWRRLRQRRYVAVVQVHGTIGLSARGPTSARGGAGLEPVIASLRYAAHDPHAVGILLEVDSPGGSALVSDLIHREVERAAEEKPLVAYFSNVAASGGYYVSAPAKRIVAQALSITGSIGVISGRVVAKELFEKIGIHTEIIRTAPHADMFSPAREMNDRERELLDREMSGFYSTFVGIVAKGRNRDPEVIEKLARGRVWTGKDAVDNGLVDEIGGFDAARNAILREVSIDPASDSYDTLVVHEEEYVPITPKKPAHDALSWLFERSPALREGFALASLRESVLLYAPGLSRIF